MDDITLEKGERHLNAEFVADKADIDAETLNKAIEKLGATLLCRRDDGAWTAPR
ncbi:MAG: hypothetical protein ACLSB9_21495 [Hydrogeniiclostridium mannosilyticum]